MKKILSFFSYIFHPLFISAYGALFYFYFGERFFMYQQVYLIIIQILLVTVLIPSFVYYLILSLSKASSLVNTDLTQRKIPLLIHSLLLFILIEKSITIDTIPELYYFFTGCLISTIIALLLIILKYKASLHIMGITTLTLFVIGISIHTQTRLTGIIALLVFCIGMIASSRLSLKGHRYQELILGAVAGIIPQVALWYFWL